MQIFKIPLNAGALSKKKGLEKAPDKIVGFLKDFYLTEKGMLPLFDVKEIKVDNNNLEQSHAIIQKEIEKINNYSILIGGDHSLTYPAFKAFAKNNPGSGMIIFDAHPDLQEKYEPPTHEDYLRVLIEDALPVFHCSSMKSVSVKR